MWRKRNLCALSVEMQIGTATVENSMEFSQKIKIELPCDPAITLLGVYPKYTKTLIQRDTYTPIFIAALFIIPKLWKQT